MGAPVLFVSHNMTAVQSLCGRVIYLAEGQVKADGEPREQIWKYLSSTKSGTNAEIGIERGGCSDYHQDVIVTQSCKVKK